MYSSDYRLRKVGRRPQNTDCHLADALLFGQVISGIAASPPCRPVRGQSVQRRRRAAQNGATSSNLQTVLALLASAFELLCVARFARSLTGVGRRMGTEGFASSEGHP